MSYSNSNSEADSDLFSVLIIIIFLYILSRLYNSYTNSNRNNNNNNTANTAAADTDATIANIRRTRLQRSNSERRRVAEMNSDNNLINCPICLTNDAEYAVETNCGHFYCGQCIITYSRSSNMNNISQLVNPQPVKCPCCRRSIDLLIETFSTTETAAINDRQPAAIQITTDIQHYNNQFGSNYTNTDKTFMDRISDSIHLLKRLYGEICTISGLIRILINCRILLAALIGMVYLILPFDLIPEALFGLLGYLDDICVLMAVGGFISSVYRQTLLQRQQHQN